MPKICPRKIEKAKWTSEKLEKAVKLVQESQTKRAAAKAMNIPIFNFTSKNEKTFIH